MTTNRPARASARTSRYVRACLTDQCPEGYTHTLETPKCATLLPKTEMTFYVISPLGNLAEHTRGKRRFSTTPSRPGAATSTGA